MARSCDSRGHRQRVFHHNVRLRGGSRPLRRSWRRHVRLHARWAPRGDSPVSSAPLPQRARRAHWSARSWCASARTCSPARRPPASTCWIPTRTSSLAGRSPYFGDGYQFRDTRYGRPVWVVPILERRVRHRPPLRLSRRADGRQSVAVRQGRRFGARCGRARARARSRGHPASSRRSPVASSAADRKPAAGIPSPSPAPTNKFCPTLRDTPGLESKLPMASMP